QAVKMVTDSNIGDWAQLSRHFPYSLSKRIGLEISFGSLAVGSPLTMSLFFYDGALVHHSRIKIDASEKKVYIGIDATNFKELTTIEPLTISENLLYCTKFVADFEADKYARFLFNNIELDLAEESIFTSEAVEAPRLYVTLNVKNNVAIAGGVYIDSFILTHNEP
ncbi:unnamed protein product, partial [marine sediment metagenome]